MVFSPLHILCTRLSKFIHLPPLVSRPLVHSKCCVTCHLLGRRSWAVAWEVATARPHLALVLYYRPSPRTSPPPPTSLRQFSPTDGQTGLTHHTTRTNNKRACLPPLAPDRGRRLGGRERRLSGGFRFFFGAQNNCAHTQQWTTREAGGASLTPAATRGPPRNEPWPGEGRTRRVPGREKKKKKGWGPVRGRCGRMFLYFSFELVSEIYVVWVGQGTNGRRQLIDTYDTRHHDSDNL
jgi:hypothetical protein